MDISKAECAGCGQALKIVRMRCPACEITLEGVFEISPLARLVPEDQAFVLAFLRHHGSIKKMEELFSISYPTVKNRLHAINRQLDQSFEGPSSSSIVLEQLAQGQITVAEALERLT